MRKVSYTQMRAELSDILDAIRNGETVVVTQRGRPDTVLNGRVVETRQSSGVAKSRGVVGLGGMVKQPGVVKFHKTIDISRVRSFPNLATKSSFEDALNKTKKKYSKIIKALEDK